MKYFLSAVFVVGLLMSSTVMAADKKAEEGAPSVHFVELSPLILPVIDARGVSQTVSLVVAVEVDSQEKADKVTKFSPRLTDAYLSDLYGTFSHKSPENGVIPISYLKERLNIMSTKVLGESVVSDVLVQVMQSRKS